MMDKFMNVKNKIVPLAAMYMIVILFVICVLTIITEDKTSPRIIFGEGDVEYAEGDDTQLLLAGVTAVDEVDGDVSYTLTIESIRVLTSGKKASVTYAARDSKNNIAKASRVVKYYSLEIVETEAVNEGTPDSSEAVEGVEDTDNPLTDNSTTVDQNTEDERSNSDTNSENQEPSVDSNNSEQTEEAVPNETVEETDEPLTSTGDPIIKLNTDKVTITAGDYFNVMNYIEAAIDDKDDVWRRIRISGDYSPNIPGEYKIRFSITDTDGNSSNVEYLTLIVQ